MTGCLSGGLRARDVCIQRMADELLEICDTQVEKVALGGAGDIALPPNRDRHARAVRATLLANGPGRC